MYQHIRAVALALVIGLMVGVAIVLPAAAPIKVLLNGVPVSFDVPPVIEHGRTLVPLGHWRGFGRMVHWDNANRRVIAESGSLIELPVGSSTAKVNGQPVELDVPATIRQGRLGSLALFSQPSVPLSTGIMLAALLLSAPTPERLIS